MGYTHYWNAKKSITKTVWSKIRKDINLLIDEADGKLAADYDLPEERALCDIERVSFNGIGLAGHDTFYFRRLVNYDGMIPRHPGFGFCKTANKPYDVYVTAALTIMQRHVGADDLILSSDGDMEDWESGIELAARVTGETYIPVLSDDIV